MLIIAAVSLVALTGCTINIGTQDAVVDPHAGHMMDGNNTSEYDAMDIMFAQMMIPHHEQAVEMSELAPGRAESSAVLELAAEIAGEQDPEIQQMKRWIDAAGASMTMDHDMPMGGMLSEQELEELAAASGQEFERLFLEGMIEHHEGAIDMAQMIIDSDNAEAKALAEAIVSSQTAQIEFMKELLAGY